jgi:hypothetical protein
MNRKKRKHIVDNVPRSGAMILIGFARTIFLLLLINTYYLNSTAIAQRTTPRNNETQNLNEEPTSVNTETQNLDVEASSTPKSTSQIPSKLGASGDLIRGTDSNDLILGLQGTDIIRGNAGQM